MASMATRTLTQQQSADLANVQNDDLLLIHSVIEAQEPEDDDSDDREQLASEDDGEGASEDEDELDDGDDDEEWTDEPSATLYKVVTVTKDTAGILTDLTLQPLSYCLKPAVKVTGSFHIYGPKIVLCGPKAGDEKIDTVRFTEIMADGSMNYSVFTNCTPNQVFDMMFNGECPARCNDGWLRTQGDLRELVERDVPAVMDYRPVCPVCIGDVFALQHQSLRETLETGHIIDLGAVVEFYGALSIRRDSLGYSFKQFDEREWGYLFDDMPSEDEDEEGDGDGTAGNDGWEYWAEALDPASCITSKPAAESAVAALPRKPFAEVKSKEQFVCQVCKEQFSEKTVVAVLPCGHFFCDEGCTTTWLKQSASCPVCRYRLPLKQDQVAGDRMDEDKQKA